MKKRWLLLVGVFLLAAGLCFAGGKAEGAKPGAKELKISLIAGFPDNLGIKSMAAEFEKETGYKLTIIETGYGAVLEKNLIDLSAKTGAYDVLHVESLWFSEYLPYLQPIDEYMQNKELFDAEKYDLADFKKYTPLALDMFTRDGKLYGLPHLAGIPINWYRQDLLDQIGAEPPRNVDEYYELAKRLTQDTDGDGKIDIYGVAMSASRSGIVDEWLSFFFAYGGGLPARPEQFQMAVLDNPIALKALTMYKSLYDECAPKESMTWEFGEVGSAMQRGIVAMMWNWSNGGSWYDDPQASKVVGKVRANVPWPGRFGVNGLCIPKDSKNKEAAFRFIAWATTKDMLRRAVLAGAATPCRASILADAELRSTRWWFEPLVEAGKISRMYLEIPEWSAMDDAMAIEFQKVLTDELTAEEALKRASENVYRILKDAGYVK